MDIVLAFNLINVKRNKRTYCYLCVLSSKTYNITLYGFLLDVLGPFLQSKNIYSITGIFFGMSPNCPIFREIILWNPKGVGFMDVFGGFVGIPRWIGGRAINCPMNRDLNV